MTDKEKYKRTFSALHVSADLITEDKIMKRVSNTEKKTGKIMPRLLAVAAALVLVVASAGFAYAADVGGVQRQIQLWVHGDQTDATIEITQDQYTSYVITYTDENGEVQERQGGGIAYDFFGRERPLTEAEVLEELNSPEVEYLEDGTVWVYYLDQKIEITDKFDEDGICYVLLDNGKDKLYVTVKYDDGWCVSSNRYPSPKEFN